MDSVSGWCDVGNHRPGNVVIIGYGMGLPSSRPSKFLEHL